MRICLRLKCAFLSQQSLEGAHRTNNIMNRTLYSFKPGAVIRSNWMLVSWSPHSADGLNLCRCLVKERQVSDAKT